MKDDSTKRPVNWFELDRLVDGQLDDGEYRELLRHIDDDPDGWRQCALAFLQHQALQRELNELSSDAGNPWPDSGEESDANSQLAELSLQSAGDVRSMRWVNVGLARSFQVAAGVAVALVAGLALGIGLRSHTTTLTQPRNGNSGIQSAFRQAVEQSRQGSVAGENRELTAVQFSPRRASSRYDAERDGPVAEEPHLGGHCRGRCGHFMRGAPDDP